MTSRPSRWISPSRRGRDLALDLLGTDQTVVGPVLIDVPLRQPAASPSHDPHPTRLFAGLLAAACTTGCFSPSAPSALPNDESSGTASNPSSSTPTTSEAPSTGDGTTNPQPSTSADSEADASTSSEGGESSTGGVDANPCAGLPPGVHCLDDDAVECDEGSVVQTRDCSATECIEAIGCAACVEGQFDCQGSAVYECSVAFDPPAWVHTNSCDPSMGEGCVVATGTCEVLEAIGTTEPTGVMHQFANFSSDAGVFLGGFDVDSYEDRIYVHSGNGTLDVYEVELLDSDGDGMLEPDQHPDDPANTGPIEQRILTFVGTLDYPAAISPSVEELYVLDDRLFKGGVQLSEYMLAGGALSTLTTAPDWAWNFSQIAFDDAHGIWYASNENNFRVLQFDPATDSWGLAFVFPAFADHTDGLEVITQADTGVPYLYVSGMLSTMLAQYRKDPDEGWVQENFFVSDAPQQPLEGMGFGALGHFWGTSGSSVFELGGGDLAPYITGSPSP